MNKRGRRKMLVLLVLFGVGVATVLGLSAFDENLLYFYSPTQVKSGEAPTARSLRVGGLVVNDSVVRSDKGLEVQFTLTDNTETIPVSYSGILPDLFREGQGIVAIGALNQDGLFVAEEVLAKHDENYMPPEVADALKAADAEGRAKMGIGKADKI